MKEIILVCGFLGAGKTTFIEEILNKKDNSLIYALVENEFGEVNIDSKILSKSQIQVKEITHGCICCSLIGDFSKAIKELKSEYEVDIVLIEPSGVAEITPLIHTLKEENIRIITIIDAKRHNIYEKNFKGFYEDQIFCADKIYLSKTKNLPKEEIDKIIDQIKTTHDKENIEYRDWSKLTYEELLGFDKNKRDSKHIHDHNHIEFYEYTMRPKKYFDIKEIEKIGKELEKATDIYRIKGFVDSNIGKIKIDYTKGEFSYEKIDYMPENFLVAIGTKENINKEAKKILGEDIND